VLAEDLQTNELVAIKKAPAYQLAREVAFMQLFQGSEDIMKIKDVLLPRHPTDYEYAYAVYEKLDVPVASAYSKVAGSKGHSVPANQAERIMYRIARGVNFMHRQGVFHLDLKPENVFLGADCSVRIMDLGQAMALGPPGTPQAISGASLTHGCHPPEFSFRSRERLKKLQATAQQTVAAEMWSLGCTFLWLLNGGDPFKHFTKAAVKGPKHYGTWLGLLVDMLGRPPSKAAERFYSSSARRAMDEHAALAKKYNWQAPSLQKAFPNIKPSHLNLIASMMSLDPMGRPSTSQLMSSPVFAHVSSGSGERQMTEEDEALHRLIRSKIVTRGLWDYLQAQRKNALFYEIALAYAQQHGAARQEVGEEEKLSRSKKEKAQQFGGGGGRDEEAL